MFSFTKIVAASSVVALSAGTALGSGFADFFFSFQNLNSGAVNGHASTTMNVGDTGSLYMYYTTNGPADSDINVGAFLDIATSVSGVIGFTGSEAYNFDITVGGIDIDDRWQAFGGGTVSADLVDELNAFRVTSGTGILESQNGTGAFVDEGYDAGADAFLFARIDFTALGEGLVDVFGSSGDGLIVHDGAPIPATFGGATIEVVPAPGVLGLGVLGFGVAAVRRRR